MPSGPLPHHHSLSTFFLSPLPVCLVFVFPAPRPVSKIYYLKMLLFIGSRLAEARKDSFETTRSDDLGSQQSVRESGALSTLEGGEKQQSPVVGVVRAVAPDQRSKKGPAHRRAPNRRMHLFASPPLPQTLLNSKNKRYVRLLRF